MLSNTDSGKVGFRPISGTDTILGTSHRGTYGSGTNDVSDTCAADPAKGIIVCTFTPTTGSSGNGIFAKTNATPGSYPVSLTFSESEITLVATASTADHTGFTMAAASKADIGEGGQFNLTLNVESGPPDAPSGFSAVGGNSLATLSWDDPDNAGITSYQYRRRTLDKVTLTWDADATATGWEYRHSRDGETSWVPDWTAIPGSDGNPATFNTFTITGVDPADTNVFEVRPAGGDVVTLTQETISGVAFGSWTPIPGSGAPTTSFVKTGLENDETYYFELRAVTPLPDGGPGEAAASDATMLVAAAPAKPTGFTAVPSGNVTEVILSWDAPDPADSTITGYEYRQTTAELAVLTWPADSGATEWQYRHSVDGGTTYSEWMPLTVTNVATATTTTFAVKDPRLVNSYQVQPVKSDVGQGDVLTGQTIIADFTGLRWNSISGSGPSTNEHRISGLDFSKYAYHFEVRPERSGEAGDAVVPTVRQLGSIALSWNDAGDRTITKYQYQYTEVNQNSATTVDSGWQVIPDSAPQGRNATSFTIPDLKALEKVPGDPFTLLDDFVYTVKLRAVNNSGDMGAEAFGTESVGVDANPGMPPDAPTGVTASYVLDTRTFTVTWDEHAITGADFGIRGTGRSGATLLATAEAGGTDLNPVAVTSETIETDFFGPFTFEVRAQNNFGPWSEWTSAEDPDAANPFAEASMTREIDEDAPAGSNIGAPVVVASEVMGFSVRYSLSESSAFSIGSNTGQLSLTGNIPAPGQYDVDVTATLSKGGVSSQPFIPVTITVTTSGPWLELGKLTPIGSADDRAGNAVAVDEDTGVIVIGAKDAGRVYVYESLHDFSPAILVPETMATDFGLTVAVDGDTVVVGSKSEEVYVFVKPETGWPDDGTPSNAQQVALLTASDTATDDRFGEAVGISGDTIVAGAGFRDETGMDNIGGAYVFVKPEDGWDNNSDTNETATLQGPSTGEAGIIGAAGDYFGRSVAIDGDNVAVGAPGKETAYLFVKPAGGWTGAVEPTATLNGERTVDGDGFGWSIDIDGGTIVVGEHQNTTGPGAAYVFTGSGSNWTQLTELSGLGVGLGEVFGYSVAVSGDYISVARRSQPDNGNAGSVQVFKKSANPGTPYVLVAAGQKASDRFGLALDSANFDWHGSPIAMDGNLLLIGATGDDQRGSDFGAAYLFTTPTLVGGSAGVASPYVDTTVTSPDGDTKVTIPGGAVPTETGYFQPVVRFSGCTGIAGRTVHDCISVQLYDLDGTLIGFSEDVRLKDGTEVTLSNPRTGGAIRVSKLGGSSRTWRTILPCSNGADSGECYTIEDDSIVVTGITSFSQYAVSTRSKAGAPGAPTGLQARGSNARVNLRWNAPSSRGSSPIIGYDYSLDGGTIWTRIPGSDVSTISYTVTNLRNGATYRFAVRAVNSAGPGPRSNIAEATPRSTSRDTSSRRPSGGGVSARVAPTFDEGASTTRHITENSPAGARIGGPVVARDPLGRRVTYSKAGPDADLFDVASQTGQIFVRRGAPLDYESGRRSYLIEVIANTGVDGPGRIMVSINVTNVAEPGVIAISPDGAPEVGTELTATLSDPDGGVTGVSWQWQRSTAGAIWTDIPGATTATYTTTGADAGMMLRASVRYNDATAAGINLVGVATDAVPLVTPPPIVDLPGSVTLSPVGAPEVGTEITATLTDPDGGVTGATWQWQRSADGVTWIAIDGASTASYTPVESDVGMMLRANVSYSDAVAAGVSLVGATTEAVAAMPAPDRPGSVTLSPEGTPEVGKAITATVTDPDGEVTGEIWQWQRSADGVTWTDIDGATTERYTPTEADAGMVLRANVSYNDAVATGVNAMGMNTEAVAASPAPGLETPTPTPTPPSPLVRPDTPTPPPTPVVPPQTPTPTQTMLPTPPPTDVPPTPTAITSEVTPTEAPTTPVTPEEEGGFPAWLIIVIIIGAVIIIAGIIIIVRSRMQQ